MRIGMDFDNTLVCYDEAFACVAVQENMLTPSFLQCNKVEIRQAMRALPNGEYEWQRLQGLVYGRLIHKAKLFNGALDFIAYAAKQPGTELFIVSHKTELAHHDPFKTNLRDAARGFLQAQGVFRPGYIPENHVFFEPTREEKIARITALECSVFIDDLPEVLLDNAFPSTCERLLFAQTPEGGLSHIPSWQSLYTTLWERAA